MEAAGIKVDVPRLERALAASSPRRLATIEAEIYELAGPRVQHRLGPAAPPGPLRRAEAPRRSRRRPGASRARRRRSSKSWPPSTRCPRLLIQHRQLAKLKSTYLDALPGPGPSRGRPGPRLVQPGAWRRPAGSARATRTSRTSRSGPRTAARSARRSWPGSPGWSLLTADYSQIELRILAHYSGDPALVARLRRGPRHPQRRSPPGSSASPSRTSTRRCGAWPRRSTSA